MATDGDSSTPWQSCFRDNLFQTKVALVTGGGTGIGRAIATELAMLGATVVIASRSHETCVEAAAEMNLLIKSGGGKVVVGPSTSIRKEEDIKNLVYVPLRSETDICHYCERHFTHLSHIDLSPITISTDFSHYRDVRFFGYTSK